jgi:hypothetical protein
MAGFAVDNPLTTTAFPEFNTAIAHLCDVLGDQTYELLARKGEAHDHRRYGDLRIRPNRRGQSRTERGFEIDDIRESQRFVSELRNATVVRGAAITICTAVPQEAVSAVRT